MAWKKVERASNMWDFEENKVLEGLYTNAEPNQGPKKNSTIHHFEVGGEDVLFWGSTVLDGKLIEVEKEFGFGNAKVKITYFGMKKGATGSHYKDFEVEVWQDGVEVVDKKGEVKDIKDEDIPVIDEDKPIDLKDIPF